MKVRQETNISVDSLYYTIFYLSVQQNDIIKMVDPTGLEPVTNRL